jgi:hypothetical protein
MCGPAATGAQHGVYRRAHALTRPSASLARLARSCNQIKLTLSVQHNARASLAQDRPDLANKTAARCRYVVLQRSSSCRLSTATATSTEVYEYLSTLLAVSACKAHRHQKAGRYAYAVVSLQVRSRSIPARLVPCRSRSTCSPGS